MRTAAILLLLSATPDRALPQAPPVGIDLYRSEQITREEMLERHGAGLRDMVEAYATGDTERFRGLYQELIAAITEMGEFSYVNLTLIKYPDRDTLYLTVDVVDAAAAEERMSFAAAPTDSVGDPEGVLRQWDLYFVTGLALNREGKLPVPAAACPVLHCIWGFDHAALRPFREVFDRKVLAHKDELVRVLWEDEDPRHRSNAAFLLAHLNDPEQVARLLVPAMSDPDATVRNDAMRVLMVVAHGLSDAKIPLEPVVRALDDPAAASRNKAAYILLGLASQADYRRRIIEQAGGVLLDLLRLLQPNNHDPAYSVLRAISGEQFDDRDYAAWRRWLAAQDPG